METTEIPDSEWELLLRATDHPFRQLIAIELAGVEQLRETEARLRSTPTIPRFAKLAFQPARDPPEGLWRKAEEEIRRSQPGRVPLLLLVDELWPAQPEAGLDEKVAAFWKVMNQLRENWHSLEAQVVFLLSPHSYRHLTLNADHLKRWMSLKLHFKPMLAGFGQDVRAEAEFADLEPFGPTDLLNLRAARQQLEILSMQLAEAQARGEPEPVLVRRYYLPLFAAAVSAGEYAQADEFRRHIRKEHLREEERDQWRRLNQLCDQRGAGEEFDVFLSYNSKDKMGARGLAAKLRELDLRVWFDEDQLIPGRPWQPLMEAGIKASRSGLVLVGADGIGPWEDEEMRGALGLAIKDKRPVIPVLLPGSVHQPELPMFLGSRTWVDLRGGFTEEGIAKLVWGITGRRPEAHGASALDSRPIATAPTVSPSRLPHAAPTLFGREQELARLDAAWADPKTHILTIIAWGGVGKTSLVVSWMARKAAAGWPGFDRVFDWTFYIQGTHEQAAASADSFIAAALEFFGREDGRKLANSPASPWDKGARLAQYIGQGRSLLVLDGLEPLQYPPVSPLAGRLKDPALEALLKGLVAINPGLCIVTTRERVAELAPFQHTTAPEWVLRHLSVLAGVELLKKLGVRGAQTDFEQLVKDVRGHALTLNLLGRYLAEAHSGDIRKRDLVRFEEADAEEQGGHAFRVMATYEKWFEDEGEKGRRALAVLRLLGLFDRPADAGCLAALRRPPAIAGLTEPLMNLTDAQWNVAISRLVGCGLVSVQDPEALPPSGVAPLPYLDAHPLIREYFARQVRAKNAEGWRAAHRRLYEHLKEITEYQPTTLEGLEPLYRAVAHGCASGAHQETFDDVYWPRIQRKDRGYAHRELGAFGEEFGAVLCFFTEPWKKVVPSLSVWHQATLLGMSASRLRAVGRVREAIRLARESYNRFVQMGRWKEAAVHCRHLSEVCLLGGALNEARQFGCEGIDLADRSGDMVERVIERTVAAHALHQMGYYTESKDLYLNAESLQREAYPDFALLCTLWGFRYCDLLLDLGDHTEAERRARQLLKATNRTPREWFLGKLDTVFCALTLSRAIRSRSTAGGAGTCAREKAFADEAVAGFRAVGKQEFLVQGLLERTSVLNSSGDFDGAKADLDGAFEIAERSSMKLYLADIHLHRARLFFREKPYPWTSPQADLAAARQLIESCGYWRRKEELEVAEKAI